MKLAESICTARSDDEAWDCIRAHRDAFFWTDDENHSDTWNRHFNSHVGGHPITQEWRNETLWFTYLGKSVQVPLRLDRTDCWLIIHVIAQLVRTDYEFRFCKDSSHSSDQAFFALPVAEWMVLESVFDSLTIARRFLRLDADFEVFLEEASPPPAVPLGRLDPALTNWIGGPSYVPAKLEYVIVAEEPGDVVSPKLERLVEQYLEPGQVGISTDVILETHWVDRRGLSEFIPLIGRHQVRVVDSTLHGFLVVELNGVAAGWRTDGKQLRGRKESITTRRWWEFWRTGGAPN